MKAKKHISEGTTFQTYCRTKNILKRESTKLNDTKSYTKCIMKIWT